MLVFGGESQGCTPESGPERPFFSCLSKVPTLPLVLGPYFPRSRRGDTPTPYPQRISSKRTHHGQKQRLLQEGKERAD